MSKKTTLDRLAEHYDTADTAVELEDATAVSPPEAPPSAERMTTFALRLPVVALDHVREIAAQRNLTTSALIRSWVEAGMANDGRNGEGRVVPVQALLELIGRAPRENAGR